MIPIVKKVTFLASGASVTVKKPSSLLTVYVQNEKYFETFVIFKNGTETHNSKSLFKANITVGKKLKTCHE